MSGFKFPPSLSDKHKQELQQRGISEEYALASGVRTAADNEARELGFLVSIPIDQRKNGLQSLCFEYRDPWAAREPLYRIRPDTQFIIDGKPAKYLSRTGDPVLAYFPHTTTLAVLEDPKTPVCITEGEMKALCIAEHTAKAGKKLAVIGLMGVNGGWHRHKKVVSKADGSKERQSYGAPCLIDALEKIAWNKRRVYIVFDSDVGSPKQATEFKRSEYAGAMGAEFQLAKLIRAQGGDVRIVEIPDDGTGEKTGADDFIARRGYRAFADLFYSSWTAQREAEKILNRARPEMIRAIEARDLAAARPVRPVFVLDKLLPEGGLCILAAAPKVGKSGIALNAAMAVCQGGRFLDVYQARKGRALYVQTEIPDWSMADRLRLLGELPDGFLISSPLQFHVNLYESSGFQKKETGNDIRVASLIEMLRQQAINLAIFDPLMYFHNLSERSEDDIRHVLGVFMMIARSVPCGVMLVHHHKKIGRSEVSYEGAEDMSGSNVLFRVPDSIVSVYRKKRSDGTSRFRMVIECRHAEEQPEYELVRCDGDNAFVWYAVPWCDQSKSNDQADKILDLLRNRFGGKATAKELMHLSGLSRSSFYREINSLAHAGTVRKEGNLYAFPTQPQAEKPLEAEKTKSSDINDLSVPSTFGTEKVKSNDINTLSVPKISNFL